MIGVVKCAALMGLGARPVRVEVHVSRGLPRFNMVGLAENSVKESQVRVHAALLNSGFEFPRGKISVNLAPADTRKDGTGFDLSVALAILMSQGVIPKTKMAKVAAIAELSLTGELRPVIGILSLAESVRDQGCQVLVVAPENALEASLIKNLNVRVATNLCELVTHLLEEKILELALPPPENTQVEEGGLDMSEICGQQEAKRAMLVAAAGGHNLLLVGGPGSGKSMLAKRMPTILPPLSPEESLLVTKVYSQAGHTLAGKLLKKRPFRSPHHSITRAGLAGGGTGRIRPGELSLATFGVLFLDELLEFPRSVLEVLRQPLEDGVITLTRANQSVVFPANVTLVCALNPCPCGHFGQPHKSCLCSDKSISSYQGRLSGPLLDRIDLHVDVPAFDLKLMMHSTQVESSSSIQQQVIHARARQTERLGAGGTNGKMSREQIKRGSFLTANAQSFLVGAANRLHMNARSFDRVIKVARTIADLAASQKIEEEHVSEALHYRGGSSFLKPVWSK
jgi:magnesium chelatase family protein